MRLEWAVVLVLIASASPVVAQQREIPPQAIQRIQKEVRHELVMLPFVTVFDNLAFRVNDTTSRCSGR